MIEIQWSPALKFFWHCDPCGAMGNGNETLWDARADIEHHQTNDGCPFDHAPGHGTLGIEHARQKGELPDLSSKLVGYSPNRMNQ